MPRTAKTSSSRVVELPSARILSTKMTKITNDAASRLGQDRQHTTLVMQMGQFIDHDITHSPTFQFADKFDDIRFEETCCNGTEFPGKGVEITSFHPIRHTGKLYILDIFFEHIQIPFILLYSSLI